MEQVLVPNRHCSICQGVDVEKLLNPPRGSGSWSEKRLVSDFLPSPGLKPGWEMTIFCHGRREQTGLTVIEVRLGGISDLDYQQKALPLDSFITPADPDNRWRFRYILGVTDQPKNYYDVRHLKPGVLLGGFLVLGDAGRVPEGVVRLPVVHIIQKYCPWN